jgi:hypothetical protein
MSFVGPLFITAIVTLTGITGSAKDNIEIRLSGRYFSAPATVQMIVALEPDPQNRTLRVEANGCHGTGITRRSGQSGSMRTNMPGQESVKCSENGIGHWRTR